MSGVGSYGSIFRGMTIRNYEQFWCEQGFWRSFDAHARIKRHLLYTTSMNVQKWSIFYVNQPWLS